LVILDAKLRLMKANRAFYRLFNLNAEGNEGRLFYELGNRQLDLPELRRALEDVLPLQLALTDFALEKQFEGAGLRSLLINARKLQAVGIGDAIFISIVDLTDRKNIEREREELQRAQLARAEADAASRAKDLFLAMVSHELRTPLGVILGWADILKRGKVLKDEQMQGIEALHRNAKSLARLVDDLLDLSRIVSGTVRLNMTTVPLDAPVRRVLDDFQNAAEEKGIRLEAEWLATHPLVHADPGRLQQIFRNILSNALKFTPAGGRILVRLSSTGARLQVSVRDTGPGVHQELLPYIFDPFKQSERGASTRNGLGLGLAIAKNLAELHGGSIRAQNPEGGGAEFVVDIPAAESLFLESDYSISADDQLPRLEGIHVLFVDDDADTRAMVARVLAESGADVTAAGSAEQALEEFQKKTPHILLFDLSMPNGDGYELLHKVWDISERSHVAAPAAVALTALVSEDERQRTIQAGFEGFLGKPVDRAKLITILADACRRMEKNC
jgi:two-component system CheB/CheR fusion protein